MVALALGAGVVGEAGLTTLEEPAGCWGGERRPGAIGRAMKGILAIAMPYFNRNLLAG